MLLIFYFLDESWEDISGEAIDLLSKMLTKADKRLTAQ